MTLNFSTCSVFPSRTYVNSDYMPAALGFEPGSWVEPCSISWEADLWDWCYQLSGESSSSIDPIDLLPSDPFGMDLSTTTAAIACWMEDLGADPNDVDVERLQYFWDQSLWLYSEYHEGFGYADKLSAISRNEIYDEGYMSFVDVGKASDGYWNSAGEVVREESIPHDGFLLSLSYLGVRDLLSVEGVCRSLRSAVYDDPYLWRCVHIDSPLSETVTDDVLLQLTNRAQGSLYCLSLVGCSRITDDGLRQVLERNPKLTELSIPGCLRISIDGLISNLKALKSADILGIKHLRLGRLFSLTKEHFEELKFLLGINHLQQPNGTKLRFYHIFNFSLSNCSDEFTLDIEMCPRCKMFTIVYDCPSTNCKKGGMEICRACEVCIPRCLQCGRCIKDDDKYVETFCLRCLCSECFKDPTSKLE